MRLFFLVAFLLCSYSAKVQTLFSKADSILYQQKIAACTWNLNKFSTIYSLKYVNDRISFFDLWLFKNKIGKAGSGYYFTQRLSKRRTVTQIKDYNSLLELKGQKGEAMYVIIKADNLSSLFEVGMPDWFGEYADVESNFTLLASIGMKIYDNVLYTDWNNIKLCLSIRIGRDELRAVMFPSRDFEKMNFESIELSDMFLSHKTVKRKRFWRDVLYVGIGGVLTTLMFISISNQ